VVCEWSDSFSSDRARHVSFGQAYETVEVLDHGMELDDVVKRV
jgi:hypothetical protein